MIVYTVFWIRVKDDQALMNYPWIKNNFNRLLFYYDLFIINEPALSVILFIQWPHVLCNLISLKADVMNMIFLQVTIVCLVNVCKYCQSETEVESLH